MDEILGGIDGVEAQPGEAVDVDIAVIIDNGECLDGTADGSDFPFIKDGGVPARVIAGGDPNNLTISFLIVGVMSVGDDETSAEDPGRRVNVL